MWEQLDFMQRAQLTVEVLSHQVATCSCFRSTSCSKTKLTAVKQDSNKSPLSMQFLNNDGNRVSFLVVVAVVTMEGEVFL
jgi:hypothetical protein